MISFKKEGKNEMTEFLSLKMFPLPKFIQMVKKNHSQGHTQINDMRIMSQEFFYVIIRLWFKPMTFCFIAKRITSQLQGDCIYFK